MNLDPDNEAISFPLLSSSSIPPISISSDSSVSEPSLFLHHRTECFPVQLYFLLEECAKLKHHSAPIQWNADGKSFFIYNRKDLSSILHFADSKGNSYLEFIHQLACYRFHRISEGPLQGSYYHPKFQRGEIQFIYDAFQSRSSGH